MGTSRKKGKRMETFVCEWKEVKDPRCLSKNNERRTPSFPDSVTDSLPLVERWSLQHTCITSSRQMLTVFLIAFKNKQRVSARSLSLLCVRKCSELPFYSRTKNTLNRKLWVAVRVQSKSNHSWVISWSVQSICEKHFSLRFVCYLQAADHVSVTKLVTGTWACSKLQKSSWKEERANQWEDYTLLFEALLRCPSEKVQCVFDNLLIGSVKTDENKVSIRESKCKASTQSTAG